MEHCARAPRKRPHLLAVDGPCQWPTPRHAGVGRLAGKRALVQHQRAVCEGPQLEQEPALHGEPRRRRPAGGCRRQSSAGHQRGRAAALRRCLHAEVRVAADRDRGRCLDGGRQLRLCLRRGGFDRLCPERRRFVHLDAVAVVARLAPAHRFVVPQHAADITQRADPELTPNLIPSP